MLYANTEKNTIMKASPKDKTSLVAMWTFDTAMIPF
jgi:hypothetical protein